MAKRIEYVALQPTVAEERAFQIDEVVATVESDLSPDALASLVNGKLVAGREVIESEPARPEATKSGDNSQKKGK